MFWNSVHPSLWKPSKIAGMLAVALTAGLLASCSSAASSQGGKTVVSGGIVTFAEPAGVTPNWILPFVGSANYQYFSATDWDAQMWRSLYFSGNSASPNVTYANSLAYPPVFSNHDTVVTISLKPWTWSDGSPITARNVLFFFNILKAEKLNWWLYIPGVFPDDVKAVKITSERTIQFTLIHSYNPYYFAQNELASLSVLPLAWDRTSLSGPRGNGSTVPPGTGAGLDMTTAGAKAVYKFLIAQNTRASAYATNWLWQIVDGPFRLSSYSVTGATTLVRNPRYGGTKARISQLRFVPFTSESSEFAELESTHTIDVGYTSYGDLHTAQSLSGYKVDPWPAWSYSYWTLNYNNPKVGPLFAQQYIRVAMQSLIDQPTIIKYVYHGIATPSLGSVPLVPRTPQLSPYAASFPYPYSPARAVSLLRQHGWAVHPGGVSTCAKPGTGPAQCGARIAAGAPLSFNLLYSSGVPENQTQALVQKTDFEKAGMVLNLKPVTPTQLITLATLCTPSQSACGWQIQSFQDNTAFPYAYAAISWETGAVYNYGGYHNPALDKLFGEVVSAPNPNGISSPFYGSQDLILRQLPSIFEPATPYQLTMVATNLHGILPQNPELTIAPEFWYFTK